VIADAAAGNAHAAFAVLDRYGVRWCLWRGSPRAARAFAGESDFDLLVDPGGIAAATMALVRADARRVSGHDSEPGTEDWFALGGPVGPLQHLHVHYRLVAGPPGCARLTLPWTDEVLHARVRRRDGLFVADPLHECALLLLRCSVQLRARDRLWPAVANALAAKVRGDMLALRPGQDLAAVRAWLEQRLATRLPIGTDVAAVTVASLWRLRSALLLALRPLAARGAATAACIAGGRDLRVALRHAARRLHLVPPVVGRTVLRGGALVVLQGGDGRGAAVARDLVALCAGKFEIRAFDAANLAAAMRVRARGALALVVADGAPLPWPLAAAPDATVRLDGPGGHAADLAAATCAVWALF